MADILIDFIGDFLSGILDFIFDPWINQALAYFISTLTIRAYSFIFLKTLTRLFYHNRKNITTTFFINYNKMN